MAAVAIAAAAAAAAAALKMLEVKAAPVVALSAPRKAAEGGDGTAVDGGGNGVSCDGAGNGGSGDDGGGGDGGEGGSGSAEDAGGEGGACCGSVCGAEGGGGGDGTWPGGADYRKAAQYELFPRKRATLSFGRSTCSTAPRRPQGHAAGMSRRRRSAIEAC